MISALLSQFAPYLIGLAALLGGLATAYFKGRGDGSAKAETKSLRKEIDARDEQLEMHREATKAERDAAAMSDQKAREEALRWAKR